MAGEISREPCPDRIVDDVGGAFAMGAIGGSAFHFIHGMHQSPKGSRLRGGLERIGMRGAGLGGGFAVWGGLFSCFDCSLVFLRQKEDPWNSIMAGVATGGSLAMRSGLRSIVLNAGLCGVLMAMVEGAQIMHNRMVVQTLQMEAPLPQIPMPPLPQSADHESEKESSWVGGLFGWGKKQESRDGGSSKTEFLESFDTPIPPMPSFEFK